MTKIVTLWAWAIPGYFSGAPVDHTWVTTYDNGANPYPDVPAVVAAGQSYWFCWGSFHPKGGTPANPTGSLGSQSGDLNLARCLAMPNVDSSTNPAARGTIFTYGIDGVCHQLANQVLYATGLEGAAPLTVSMARGYAASNFIYGTYGLQHAAWASKIASCRVAPAATIALRGEATVKPQDEFEVHARKVLGPTNQHLVAPLLKLRDQLHAQRADVLVLQGGQSSHFLPLHRLLI